MFACNLLFAANGASYHNSYATNDANDQSFLLLFLGVSPADVDVVELHDCFSTNELLTYEALGLCKEGEIDANLKLSIPCPYQSGVFISSR